MPGLDRTGPEGEGPRTGWGEGKCNPPKSSKEDNDKEKNNLEPGQGRGFRFFRGQRGIGRGQGRGLRRGGGRGQGRGLRNRGGEGR